MKIKGPHATKYTREHIAKPGKTVQLRKIGTTWSGPGILKTPDKEEAQRLLAELLEKDRLALAEAQELLAATRQHAILVVLQGMDTAGKDGTIRHVMSGINPQGCMVHSFKVPGAEDHAHDFLWRYSKVLPERGMIAIFNRSYYEDVLVVRVHPERMEILPPGLGPEAKGFWEARYHDINAFEKHLVRNGTLILKFFLHISKEEQKRRLLGRLDSKKKYWKFSDADLAERKCWDQYTEAYGEMLSATSTDYAPWFIVPADSKAVARTFVAEVMASAITGLGLSWPEIPQSRLAELAEAKKQLENEG